MMARQRSEIDCMAAEISQLRSEAEQRQKDLSETRQQLAEARLALEDQTRRLEEEIQSGQAETRELQRQIDALQEVVTRQNEQQHSLTTSRLAGAPPSDHLVGDGPSEGFQRDEGLRVSHLAAEQHSGVCEDREEQMTILTAMVRTLKMKLAQATREKVEALMNAASTGQKLEASHHHHQQQGEDAPRQHWLMGSGAVFTPHGKQEGGGMSAIPTASMSNTFLAFMSARLGISHQTPHVVSGASQTSALPPWPGVPAGTVSPAGRKGKSELEDAAAVSVGSEQTVRDGSFSNTSRIILICATALGSCSCGFGGGCCGETIYHSVEVYGSYCVESRS